MAVLKVEGHTDLVRDTNTNAIVRTSNEYSVYMKRVKDREKGADKMRMVCSEINNLKAELREIKGLIKELVNGS